MILNNEQMKTRADEYWELYWDMWNDGEINESDYESGFDYWALEAQDQLTLKEIKKDSKIVPNFLYEEMSKALELEFENKYGKPFGEG